MTSTPQREKPPNFLELHAQTYPDKLASVGLERSLTYAQLRRRARSLAESGETAPKLAKLSSTTFDSQLQVCSSVANENPDLYFEIQSLNDYGTESLTALLYAVERLRSIIRAGDVAEFRKLMEQGRDYLAGRPSGGDAPP